MSRNLKFRHMTPEFTNLQESAANDFEFDLFGQIGGMTEES